MTFSAVASGGLAPYQFKWWVLEGSTWKVGQDWGTSATFSWRPTTAGDYMVAVWARNKGVKANASEALAQVSYKVTGTASTAPLSITSFTSNLASPQVTGTTITFQAVATGGEAPYQFKWWVYDGSAWRVAQNWNSSATLAWRPTTAGDYMVAVWVRNNNVTINASQVMAQAFYTITGASNASAAGDDRPDQQRCKSHDARDVGHVFGCGIGRCSTIPIQVVGIRRFRMEGRAGLEPERHIQLATDKRQGTTWSQSGRGTTESTRMPARRWRRCSIR